VGLATPAAKDGEAIAGAEPKARLAFMPARWRLSGPRVPEVAIFRGALDVPQVKLCHSVRQLTKDDPTVF
jgi:hypothetical protein